MGPVEGMRANHRAQIRDEAQSGARERPTRREDRAIPATNPTAAYTLNLLLVHATSLGIAYTNE